VPIAALALLLSLAGFASLRHGEHRALTLAPLSLARRLAVFVATLALATAMLSCGGGTSAPNSSASSAAGGGSTPVSFPMVVQAQSGSATMNLATISVTVP
jgi:hypothetical protein